MDETTRAAVQSAGRGSGSSSYLLRMGIVCLIALPPVFAGVAAGLGFIWNGVCRTMFGGDWSAPGAVQCAVLGYFGSAALLLAGFGFYVLYSRRSSSAGTAFVTDLQAQTRFGDNGDDLVPDTDLPKQPSPRTDSVLSRRRVSSDDGVVSAANSNDDTRTNTISTVDGVTHISTTHDEYARGDRSSGRHTAAGAPGSSDEHAPGPGVDRQPGSLLGRRMARPSGEKEAVSAH